MPTSAPGPPCPFGDGRTWRVPAGWEVPERAVLAASSERAGRLLDWHRKDGFEFFGALYRADSRAPAGLDGLVRHPHADGVTGSDLYAVSLRAGLVPSPVAHRLLGRSSNWASRIRRRLHRLEGAPPLSDVDTRTANEAAALVEDLSDAIAAGGVDGERRRLFTDALAARLCGSLFPDCDRVDRAWLRVGSGAPIGDRSWVDLGHDLTCWAYVITTPAVRVALGHARDDLPGRTGSQLVDWDPLRLLSTAVRARPDQ